MARSDDNCSALKSAIEAAFDDNDDDCPEADQLCNSNHQDEQAKLLRIFGGKRWRDWAEHPVDLFLPITHCHSIPRLAPAAFRYYLPLLLILLACYPDRVDVLGDELVRSFIRPGDAEGQAWYRQAVGELSQEQIRVVLQVLEYHESRIDPRIEVFRNRYARARFSLSYYLTPHY